MNDLVIHSRVQLIRNLKKYPFPVKMTCEQGREIKSLLLNLIQTVHEVLGDEYRFEFIDYEETKGTLYCPCLGIRILINEEDHIKIQVICEGEQLQKAYEIAENIDNAIEQQLEYAYTENYGYLTSSPTNIGTGLQGSYLLHMPALDTYGQLHIIVQAVGKFGIGVCGLHGEGLESYGSIFKVSNRVTIGQSEKDILYNVENMANQILDQEIKVRQRLLTSDAIKLEDKVYRSYGQLKFSRMLDYKEAMDLLSDMKLGIGLGFIKEMKDQFNINDLIKNIQPSALINKDGSHLEVRDVDQIRAHYIREALEQYSR